MSANGNGPPGGNRPPGRTEPVAIVGMDVLLPGSGSLDHYWQNLAGGVDAIKDAPEHRVERRFLDPEKADKPNRIYCYRGGFVDEFAEFDPMAYGIMPASIAATEPEQLIALKVAAGAIEDAGGMDRLPDREKVGVILGRLGQSGIAHMKFYARVRLSDQILTLLRQLLPGVSEDKFDEINRRINTSLGPYQPEGVIGLMPNLTASRVANRLDLRGPAYTLDAACASSLIALDHGIAELTSGRLDMVLCGGVHHNHDVAFWSVFTQIRALSRDMQIRPFDTKADGLLIGEGTGVVAIKRLSDALRDGDRIHAVIRGIGTSSDGRAASLVNPETAGQVVAVRRAWEAAGLDPLAPDALGLLEAHGTGTPVGDAAEIATMIDVFGPPQEHFSPVIGSVKSMIGHTMPAAGVAGLIKATLAVERGMLLPTLHCDEPRPELAKSRFRPIAQAQPWPEDVPRRAAVNAFGFGGINAHVILEQAPDAPKPRRAAPPAAAPAVAATAATPCPVRLPVTAQAQVTEPDQMVLLAAPDQAALARLLDSEDHEIRAHGLRAGTGAAGAPAAGPRLAVVEPTPERLSAARKVVGAGHAWRGGRDIWFSPRPMLADGKGRIAFVFPGLEAELSNTMDDVISHFGLTAGPPVEAGKADFSTRFIEVMRLGWLLHDALGHIGVAPDAVAGHSLGEWTAGLIAGLVDESMLGDYATLLFNPVFQRQDLHHAVIGTSADTLSPDLVRYPGVYVSLDNAPAQCVVCGPAERVTQLIDELSQRNVLCRPLPFATGMHTPYMEPYLEPLRPLVDVQQVRKPRMEVWSSAMAAPIPANEAEQRELFYRQLVEPVRFRATVAAMHQAGIRAFLQVGPGQLASLIQDNLRGEDHLAIPVNVEFRSGLAQLRRVAAALWVEGHAPDLPALAPAARGTFAQAAAPAQSGPAETAAGQPTAAASPAEAAATAETVPAAAAPPAEPAAASSKAKAAGKLAVMLDLGSPPISMGDDPGNLLSSDVVSVKTAMARGIPAASNTAVGKLGSFAGHSPASVELAALLEDTASAAVAVLSASGTRTGGTRPAGPRPAPTGPGRGQPAQPRPAQPRPAQPRPAQPRPAQSAPASSSPARTRPAQPAAAGGMGNGNGGHAARQTLPNPQPAGGDAESGYKSILRISLAEMPYVLDHVFFPQPDDWPHVGDRMPVVPACTMIQFMIDAVLAVAPGKHVVEVADARFSRWMLCEPPSEVEITVKPAGPDVYNVTLGAFVRARMRTGQEFEAGQPEIWQQDPATERPTPLSVERMYADRILFHGPRYRGVEKVHALGDRHIRGTLRVPAPPGGLLDAGLQILGNWVDVTLPTRFVVFPTGFDSIRFFGPAPAVGERVEFVGRIPSLDDRQVVADFQIIAGGRIWAEAKGAAHQRFDSHPKARPTELAPGRNSFADPQPEGWVQIFDYWPYPESSNSCSALTMGTAGFFEFQSLRIADRKPWLLSRLAVKDAVRFLIWDDDGTREIFPIEIRVTGGTDGYARVEEWRERKIPAFEASYAHAGQCAVAIARPAGPPDTPGAPGIGIGMTVIHDDPEKAAKAAAALSAADITVLDATCAQVPGTARQVWVASFLAAKEATAKAEGIALADAPGTLSVTAATPSAITVAAPDRSYQLPHRQIRNPDDMAQRRYAVAWTRGPQPTRSS